MNNYPKSPFKNGDDVQVSHDGKVWENGRYLCSSSSRYYAYTYDYDGGPNPYKYCRYASQLTMNDNKREMNKELYILRGLPGSGKSTLAESLGGYHLEADMFFTGDDGEYNFDPKLLPTAHKWCQGMVEELMGEGVERIVVSNTSTQQWEMGPYFALAEENGYTVFSLIVENRHGGSNIHDVPSEAIERMKNRFEVQL